MNVPPATGVTLRRATVDDLHLIVDAIRTPEDLVMWAGPRHDWPVTHDDLAADLAQMAATDTCLSWMVLDSDNASVGYVELTVSAELATGHVSRVLVLPHVRGRGFGRALMHAVINAANERALTTVTLNVHHENARARSLYEQLGFTYIDRTSMSETRRMRLRLPTT